MESGGKSGIMITFCLLVHSYNNISSGSSSLVEFNVSDSPSLLDWDIIFLEHVVVTLSLAIESSEVFNVTDYYAALDDDSVDIDKWLENEHARRGDIQIELTSPSNTKSILLPYRKHDFINDVGYDSWPFISVHFWGEDPTGIWRLNTTYRSSSGSVFVWNISLTMFGVSDMPRDTNQRTCDMCSRGCGEVCDVCPQLRNNATQSLGCVSVCPNSTTEYSGYCINGDIIYPANSESKSANILVIIIVSVVTLVSLVTIVTCFIVFVLIKRKRKRLPNIDINYTRLEFEDNI